MVKQTAGRDQLGIFAEEFARLNDDVLFGEGCYKQEGKEANLTNINERQNKNTSQICTKIII